MTIQSVVKFFSNLGIRIKQFISDPTIDAKVERLSQLVASLLPYAIQAVQLIASATPNRNVAEINAVLQQVGLIARIDDSTPAETIKGLLLQAASAALRGNLKIAIERAGTAGIEIAGEAVTDITHLPPSTLDTAVQVVYGLSQTSMAIAAVV